ncbi:MAG: type II secretion system F family protein [bacterium]
MSQRNQIIYILHNLQFLLESGFPIVSCLDVISQKSENKSEVRIKAESIKNQLLKGDSFSVAFSSAFNNKVPNILNIFIQIGESCGNLGHMLAKAIETDNKIKKINSSFFGALAYPAFIFCLAVLMMLATMIGIMPKLLPIFRDLHVDLPIYTRFFIAVSNGIIHFGLYVLTVIFLGCGIFFYYLKKSSLFLNYTEKIILKIWGIGNLYIRYSISTIALCLSQYLRSGYSLYDAMQILAKTTRSPNYRSVCSEIGREIQNGKNIGSAILPHARVMPNWSYVLDIASQSGRLADQFERLYVESVMYIEEASAHIRRWSEPALMLCIGGVIALFAISIISPIYSVVQHAGI